jgi:hypothetical protein
MYNGMLEKEKKMLELKIKWKNNFMEIYEKHVSLTSDMRAILLDWMC